MVGAPLPLHALRYLSALWPVRREVHAFRPDVTVAHFLPNYGFLAALAGVRPFALVCWGSDLLVNARRTPLHRARARFVLRRADWIHVDAAVLADAAVSLGAPPKRVWTRAWGVDSAAFEHPIGTRAAGERDQGQEGDETDAVHRPMSFSLLAARVNSLEARPELAHGYFETSK